MADLHPENWKEKKSLLGRGLDVRESANCNTWTGRRGMNPAGLDPKVPEGQGGKSG